MLFEMATIMYVLLQGAKQSYIFQSLLGSAEAHIEYLSTVAQAHPSFCWYACCL